MSGTIQPKGGEPVTAPLTYLAPVADETTADHSSAVRGREPAGPLRPREYVDVQLAIAGPPTLAVPVSAVTTVDRCKGYSFSRDVGYAFVRLRSAAKAAGGSKIWQGLKAGDQVVVEGVFDLKNVLLKEHIGSGE